MKNIILVILALVLCVSLTNAQTPVNRGGSELTPSNLWSTHDIQIISAWSPWTNLTDSTNKKYSSVFDVGKYDSISCFVLGTTTRGVVDVKTVLLVSFDGSNFATNDTTRVLCDTVVSKSTVLAQFKNATSGSQWVATDGALKAKLALTPTVSTGASATYANHSNDILYYYLICHRRLK